MNRFLVGRRTRSGVRLSRVVKALLLPALDLPATSWAPASSSCSMGLIGELTQGFCWVIQDTRVIAKDESLNMLLPNRLADLLGIELLKI